MSHSKQTKRGFSLYLNKWNPSAKKYINTCSICGQQGYSPAIPENEFYDKNPDTYSENRVVYEELTKIFKALSIDHLNRCEICEKIHDSNNR